MLPKVYASLTQSLIATVIVLVGVCILPIRWDNKSFGPVLPRFDEATSSSLGNILFVTANNEWESGHYTQYGLDLLTFPHGRSEWLVFKEGWRDGPWIPNWLVDESGRFYARGSNQNWQGVTGSPAQPLSIVVESPDVKARLLQRWDGASSERVLIADGGLHSIFERPRLRVGWSQGLRLFAFVLVLALSAAFFARIVPSDSPGLALFNYAVSFPAALLIHTVLVFFLGKITSASILWAISIEIVLGLGLAVYASKKSSRSRATGSELFERLHARRVMATALVAAGVLLYTSFSMFKADFDGDMFTQYLPVARYHHLNGTHDPQALMGRYGLMTHAAYPPAFPIVISTMMWIAEMPKAEALHLDAQTNLMVFLYRLLVSVLHLSFLVAVAGLFWTLSQRESSPVWLLPVLAIPLVIPLFLGHPSASEIYTVPLTGFSIVALFAGERFQVSAYTVVGLLLGSFGLFLKKEGLVIFLLIVLPWYVAGRLRQGFSLRGMVNDSGVVFLGLCPFLLWRLDLRTLDIPEYFFYESISLQKLMASGAALATIAQKALKLLLASDYWVVVFLILPIAVSVDLLLRKQWKRMVIPIGVIGYVGAMTLVYVFSRHPDGPIIHMDVSYERILAVSIMSGILYSASVLICGGDREDTVLPGV